jgi:ribonuclease HII
MTPKERERVLSLYEYEKALYFKGLNFVAGTDEAGRGPLAGPVCAAAVILPKYAEIEFLNDSKRISANRRKAVFEQIMLIAVSIGVCFISSEEIDNIGVGEAVKKAMAFSVLKLNIRPEFLLIDGNIPIVCNAPQKTIIRGDQKSASIAAASIVAKVMRDNVMCKYAETYPLYDFDKHKGYGTKKHIEAIRTHGICPIHRKTFSPCGGYNG